MYTTKRNKAFKFIYNCKTKWILILIFYYLLSGCAGNKNIQKEAGPVTLDFSIHGGPAWGGIIEYTSPVKAKDEEHTLDAISGATKIRYNAGLHVDINIKERTLETGLDYVSYRQSISMTDGENNYDGTRDIRLHQVNVPLTYNFKIIKNSKNHSLLNLKAGLSLGNIVSHKSEETGVLPEYDIDNFTFGPLIGLSSTPFNISGHRLGFYLDFYRGMKNYSDLFHMSDKIGNLSSLRFGVILY